jgi:hypothetical protein
MLQISDLQASMDSMGGGGSFNAPSAPFNVFGEARIGDLQGVEKSGVDGAHRSSCLF